MSLSLIVTLCEVNECRQLCIETIEWVIGETERILSSKLYKGAESLFYILSFDVLTLTIAS